MQKVLKPALLLLCSGLLTFSAVAWGPEGHAIVGRLALRFVHDDVRKNVLQLLGDMPIDTAANWMDIMKADASYDFMRSWHYIDFAKGTNYQPSDDENIINRLRNSYRELKHKQTLCGAQVRTDLLVLLHLVGDLHMPLHTGYDDDLGGNKVMVQFDSIKSHNLHRYWDEDIIALSKITDADCLSHLDKQPAVTSIDFVAWMHESRSLLPSVYNYEGFLLTNDYLQRHSLVVQQQLLRAGLRLSAILNELFASPAADIDFTSVTRQYKNGIDVQDAMQHVGKTVTVAARVYSIRSSASITQMNLGGKYPNAPLTVIIFGKNYAVFNGDPEPLFKDRNVLVKGKIEMYKGKPQIIVSKREAMETL